MSLNSEQRNALRAVQAGRNIFLTGPGGTGKSHTIRSILEWASSTGKSCAVTAMTGCAALLLNNGKAGGSAKTLHSWAGVGLAREAPHELADAIKRNWHAQRRWNSTDILIIDEVSMMTTELLEKLDLVARRVRRKSDKRFGGIQLVLVGDFCQLPPVFRGVSGEEGTRFVFESMIWSTLIDETVELKEIQRQTDPVFQGILNEARMGRLSAESVKILETRINLPWQENEIRPTLIFTRNAEVDKINKRNLEALETERQVYDVQTVMMDTDTTPYRRSATTPTVIIPDKADMISALERLDADAPYEKQLELRVGAQVMLLFNMDQEAGLVNGSRGVVESFTAGGLPVVKFLATSAPVVIDRNCWWLSDYDGIGRSQIPLKVAYSITTHRSQGATLDSALIDIGSSTFEYGQAYVALSRVRSLEGLYIFRLDPTKIRAHPSVVAFYERIGRPASPPVPVAAGGSSVTGSHCELAVPWTTDGLSQQWLSIINPYLETTGKRIAEQIQVRTSAEKPMSPDPADVFAALRACPDPTAVKVIILGQDPYPTAGHAHGLAFSVRPEVAKLPPSLQNIYKELGTDVGVTRKTGCLTDWAEQGVLLLNDVLTVSVGSPQSHSGIGWEGLTSRILATVLDSTPHVVVVAWGRFAQKKLEERTVAGLIAARGHTVLRAPHPSPLSAHTGFFGSCPFSHANTALVAHGLTPIVWG